MATATATTDDQKTGLARLGRAVSRLEDQIRSGELLPYTKRLEPFERWKALQKLIADRGIRYAGCSFDNFAILGDQCTAARDIVLDFVDTMPRRLEAGGGLVFLGPPGTGKDHLMMAALRMAVIDHGFTVKWSDGIRLYARIKSAIADDSTEELLRECVKPQILALSDPIPPRDSLTAYELAILRDIVERRYSAALSTWVTTNVTDRATAEALFTGAVLDRLLHGATEVNLCGLQSYRLR